MRWVLPFHRQIVLTLETMQPNPEKSWAEHQKARQAYREALERYSEAEHLLSLRYKELAETTNAAARYADETALNVRRFIAKEAKKLTDEGLI